MSIDERTNAVIRLTPCRGRDKKRLAWSRIDALDREGALAARVRDQKAAKAMFDLLLKTGREARILSSAQSEAEQARTVAWFGSAERPALVVADGTAIPARPDIRQCLVMNIPPSLSAALGDIRSVGGDGLLADIEFFASAGDRDLRLAELDRLAENPAGPGIDRINQWRREIAESVAWIENDGCARRFLHNRLFGVDSGVCGNCGWCLGRRTGLLPKDE